MSAEFERLVGLAVMDADFRTRLLADTDATLTAHGFTLTEAERAKVAVGINNLATRGTETLNASTSLYIVW